MSEFPQKNSVMIVVVALISVVVAFWVLWANFLRGGQADLPAGAPAAGGRVPGPMGATVPGSPNKTGTRPGSIGR